MRRSKLHLIGCLAALGLILGCHQNHIALLNEALEPVQVFPYSLDLLPPADQEALRRGIPIGGKEELHRLLEDYLS